MPTLIRRLFTALNQERSKSGFVPLSDDLAPGVSDIAFRLTGDEVLAIQNARVELPYLQLSRMKLSSMSQPKRVSGRYVKQQRKMLGSVAIVLGALSPDSHPDADFEPLLPLLAKEDVRADGLRVRLRSKGVKEGVVLDRSFYSKLTSLMTVRGQLRNGDEVQASFWPEKGELQHLITVRSRQTFDSMVLQEAYHTGLGHLHFGKPLIIHASSSFPASTGTMGINSGSWVYFPFSFGPNLSRAVRHGTPLVLQGQLHGRHAVRLTSPSFTLAFPDITLRDLHLEVRVAPNEEGAREAEARLLGSYAHAQFLGTRYDDAVPLWSDLPPDPGVLCWNSGWPPALDEKDDFTGAASQWPPIGVDSLPVLFGGLRPTQRIPRLKPVLDAAVNLRLAELHVGIDLPTQAVSDVVVTLFSEGLEVQAPPILLSPVVFRFVVGQPHDPAARFLKVTTVARTTLDGVAFEGGFRAPRCELRLTPVSESVSLEDCVQALRLHGHESFGWREPPSGFSLNVDVYEGTWKFIASNDVGQQFVWSSS
ncbi:hypothetical protein [Corallococcus macrosporus]|uniref:Uncharacterized protein n=1 Tax=Corallococcus macrosporus DSM 14697 TaxID=1189310 RepID=A0A250K6P2_9BACT|nr:hypothetical protein [Corallococcus macrosporus]ATB51126.1 hypothetical protein MYMAC_006783 [Corallococcus macrosporus DSM 14697]